LLDNPALSDVEAERILDHLYSVAHVTVDAVMERLERPGVEFNSDHVPIPALAHDSFESPSAA
jgi:hypothetical protein